MTQHSVQYDCLYLCTDNNAKSRRGLEALHEAHYTVLVLIYMVPPLRKDPKRPRELYLYPHWYNKKKLADLSPSIYCHENKIPYLMTHELDLMPLFPLLNSIQFSLLISNSWPSKIPRKIYQLAQREAINFHSSYLPEYRGGNITYAPLINEEKTSGLTAHVITDRFDAGAILAQLKFKLSKRETPRSLTNKRALYIKPLMLEAVRIAGNKTQYKPNPPSPYYNSCRYFVYLKMRLINKIRGLLGLKKIKYKPKERENKK